MLITTMGNTCGIRGRSNGYDPESVNELQNLRGNASDQIVKKCDCVDEPETKCLHWAIKERNIEYAS